MRTNWGLFICNCRRTLPLELEQFVLPTAPSVLSFASDPEIDIHDFVARAKRDRLDRVLISCCADAALFEDAFGASGPQPLKVHFLNLKDSCFFAHADSEKAHSKATRLLRAAMDCAEQDSQPLYNRLAAGNRIVIATDGPQGAELAQSLSDVAQPMIVVDPSVSTLDAVQYGQVHRGRIIEVKGRLSDFHVIIENVAAAEMPRRELHADQVVIISQNRKPSLLLHGFIPQVIALFYYHISWILYVIRPKWSYLLNAYFEDHAEHEYMEYVAENSDLEAQPFDSMFVEDYGQFPSLADTFRQIGYDERVHKLESLARVDAARFS